MLRGYYAILDVGAEESAEAVVARARRLLAARPCMLQVRAKHAPAAALAALGRAVGELTRTAGIPLCVNDRLDVALAVGAEAVHLGQEDLPLLEARRIAAGRLLVGISTHDAAQAAAAREGGADYLGFGPIFPTGTKHRPDPVVGVRELARVVQAGQAIGRAPVVAIGGITLENVAEVAAAGAAAAALIAAVNAAPDPTAVGRAVNAAFGD